MTVIITYILNSESVTYASKSRLRQARKCSEKLTPAMNMNATVHHFDLRIVEIADTQIVSREAPDRDRAEAMRNRVE